jgi:hypothetical protein
MKKFPIEAERVSGYVEHVAKEVNMHRDIVPNRLQNYTASHLLGQVTGIF